jgi:hypothetical protein
VKLLQEILANGDSVTDRYLEGGAVEKLQDVFAKLLNKDIYGQGCCENIEAVKEDGSVTGPLGQIQRPPKNRHDGGNSNQEIQQ